MYQDGIAHHFSEATIQTLEIVAAAGSRLLPGSTRQLAVGANSMKGDLRNCCIHSVKPDGIVMHVPFFLSQPTPRCLFSMQNDNTVPSF